MAESAGNPVASRGFVPAERSAHACPEEIARAYRDCGPLYSPESPFGWRSNSTACFLCRARHSPRSFFRYASPQSGTATASAWFLSPGRQIGSTSPAACIQAFPLASAIPERSAPPALLRPLHDAHKLAMSRHGSPVPPRRTLSAHALQKYFPWLPRKNRKNARDKSCRTDFVPSIAASAETPW